MSKIKIAIYDVDKGYRERFADYLMSYKAEEMEIFVFSGEQYFFEALDVDKYHLFVLGNGYEAVLSRVKILKTPTLVLAEYVQSFVRESIESVDEQIVFTSRYQSMDVITRQMKLMTEKARGNERTNLIVAEKEIIGIFSPVKHEMQMLFSLLYAKCSAKPGGVLYINLLEFSGFSELFGETEFDLGDIILLLRDGCVSSEMLHKCIYDMEGFSYISPLKNPESMKEITGEDISRLIDVVSRYTDFKTVIIDMGICMSDFVEVLIQCSTLLCLSKSGYLFESQTKQFFSYLEKMIDEAFLERIQMIPIPYNAKSVHGGVNLLEQLNWSEFGDFVREKVC